MGPLISSEAAPLAAGRPAVGARGGFSYKISVKSSGSESGQDFMILIASLTNFLPSLSSYRIYLKVHDAIK